MKVRRPECEEHPSRPITRYALANQTTILCGVIGPPRSDTITGPAEWVAARHAAKALAQIFMQWDYSAAPFLGGMVGQFQNCPDGACRVGDHGPSQVGDLSGS